MTPQELPLEIWFHILNQALNMFLPTATTPQLYSTYIAPLLLTSHTFHKHCHPVTYPHLRKHKLLRLFTRWKAAHSREVHFYHHPLRNHVRYALPDRVGNPPSEEYEALYSFIKRSYLFGCESVCGTVIPVEGGLEVPVLAPTPTLAPAPALANDNDGTPANATATNNFSASFTGTGANTGNVVVAPPPTQVIAPIITHNGGEGGGQGWRSHSLQWHVANPTFAAEGTIDLYKDVVEEYRRVVCGNAAARERDREIERIMDMMKNPHRYTKLPPTGPQVDQLTESEQDDEEEEEHYTIEGDENELLSEIGAKGGLRRRDSGHAQSSSEMDVDEDIDDEENDEDMMSTNQWRQALRCSRSVKREPETMDMDYKMESSTRYRRGLRSRKLERSLSANEEDQLIMDMALPMTYHPFTSLVPFHPLDTNIQTPSSPSRMSRENSSYNRSRSSRSTLQRCHSSPGSTSRARISNQSQSDSTHILDSSSSSLPSRSSSSSSTLSPEPINPSPSDNSTENSPVTNAPRSDDSSMNVDSFAQPQERPMRAEDLDFDLASACANTFASDLAFVLARVPGLGAHLHRFEQLAKLKLHVGWAKHAQSRGGNDVFVMSCSRLISLLAPLANTPLVSERENGR
ncbi:hypothetical protein BGZ80_001050 [Entomortierella chlamydospora]|uniref:Uncharacterized protein n=1 Tax=Entomortierella chlamydospora TaxID=101097 RepID=A0A9P6MS19_9FUNG|nr:hypothetical protein BGZ79_002966 [Entomortierella chlamydospora]KAG0010967.1 hypothetical protein BGZ80_001050 [Entomortierella chlamydospora]